MPVRFREAGRETGNTERLFRSVGIPLRKGRVSIRRPIRRLSGRLRIRIPETVGKSPLSAMRERSLDFRAFSDRIPAWNAIGYPDNIPAKRGFSSSFSKFPEVPSRPTASSRGFWEPLPGRSLRCFLRIASRTGSRVTRSSLPTVGYPDTTSEPKKKSVGSRPTDA